MLHTGDIERSGGKTSLTTTISRSELNALGFRFAENGDEPSAVTVYPLDHNVQAVEVVAEDACSEGMANCKNPNCCLQASVEGNPENESVTATITCSAEDCSVTGLSKVANSFRERVEEAEEARHKVISVLPKAGA